MVFLEGLALGKLGFYQAEKANTYFLDDLMACLHERIDAVVIVPKADAHRLLTCCMEFADGESAAVETILPLLPTPSGAFI